MSHSDNKDPYKNSKVMITTPSSRFTLLWNIDIKHLKWERALLCTGMVTFDPMTTKSTKPILVSYYKNTCTFKIFTLTALKCWLMIFFLRNYCYILLSVDELIQALNNIKILLILNHDDSYEQKDNISLIQVKAENHDFLVSPTWDFSDLDIDVLNHFVLSSFPCYMWLYTDPSFCYWARQRLIKKTLSQLEDVRSHCNKSIN